MAGTNILIPLKRGDEVVVYAYTGTWLADFAMNHYTHWVGLLLKVSKFHESIICRIKKTNIVIENHNRAIYRIFYLQPNEEECDNFLKEACDGVDAGEIGQIVA